MTLSNCPCWSLKQDWRWASSFAPALTPCLNHRPSAFGGTELEEIHQQLWNTFLLHSLFLELRKLRFRDIKYFHKVELVEDLRGWVIKLIFYYNLTLNTWYQNLFQPPVAEHQSKPGIFSSFPISTTITVLCIPPILQRRKLQLREVSHTGNECPSKFKSLAL